MFEAFRNIFKIEDLRNRIFFVLLMLVVYRIGAHIPVPGIDRDALSAFFDIRENTIFSFFDMFSGGALGRLTVFALGVMPYISASIIIQLLTIVLPSLERLSKEGELGRRKITAYTRYGTVLLAVVQGFGIAVGLQSMQSPTGASVVYADVNIWQFRLVTMITLTAGTVFLMWIGELINERGIGNGISLLIFASIVASIPGAIFSSVRLVQAGQFSPMLLAAVSLIIVVVIFLVVFIETATRRIVVQYAKRVRGNKMMGGQSTYLPLKINSAGVIPPIFASSLLAFPATIAGFIQIDWVSAIGVHLLPTAVVYNVIFVLLIVFFCFFYTAIQFNPVKISEELRRHGGYVPGIRPGQKTVEYINHVLTRITFGGAIYLASVCVLPVILFELLDVPFFFGGTALLIVIGVSLDTIRQMEAFLLNRDYDGFMKKSKKRTGMRKLKV